ncbi:class I SAM-dependent methyltransferase [bacterium]|nr:class I SAM-dependent methyltransferase [bacterium]
MIHALSGSPTLKKFPQARGRTQSEQCPDSVVLLGRHAPPIPARVADLIQEPRLQLGGFPSRRWVVTPHIEASHRQQVEHGPEPELRDSASSELKTLIGPLLHRRYGHRQGMDIAELGPATSTTVAATLSHATHRYLAVDLSEPYLEKQQEFLAQDTATQCYAVKGDSYALPIQDGKADLIVTSCHPPFVSASTQDKAIALDEVWRTLKEDGEFVLFPYDPQGRGADMAPLLEARFEIVDQSQQRPDRVAVVLKKRPLIYGASG